jgi:hypothetical protein
MMLPSLIAKAIRGSVGSFTYDLVQPANHKSTRNIELPDESNTATSVGLLVGSLAVPVACIGLRYSTRQYCMIAHEMFSSFLPIQSRTPTIT